MREFAARSPRVGNVGDVCGARSPIASGRFAILADSDVREEQSVPTVTPVTPTRWDRERNVPGEDAHSGISLGGVVATAMDLEDTESAVSNNSLTAALECDLAAHVVSEAHGTQCAVVGEDLPRSSRRSRLIWNEDADPQVRVAQALIENLVHRVGPVAPGTALPWNVPLMWSAASDGPVPPVLHWLMECASSIAEPVSFHGGECSASEAVRIGFNCLRDAMRSWGISSH